MMRKVIYKSTAVQFMILLVAVLALSTLWPLHLWKKDNTIGVPPVSGTYSEVVNNGHTLMQTFLSQGTYMEAIRLYPEDVMEDGCFYVKVLDEKQQVVAKEQVVLSAQQPADYVDVPMQLTMEEGKTYFLILQGERPKETDDYDSLVEIPAANVKFAYEYITGDVMPGAGILYYDEEQIFGAGLAAEYQYRIPIGYKRTLLFGGAILALTALLLFSARQFFKKESRNPLITVEQAFRWIANPLAALFVLAGFLLIFTGKLSLYPMDNLFYVISMLLLTVVLFYGINHRRDGQETVFTLEYCRKHLADFLQVIFLAGAINACCDYMSGLYDIHHRVAERREMLFFALILLTMFSFKELFCRYTLLYFVVAGIGGVLYYRHGLSLLAAQEIKEAEMGMNVEVLRNTVLIVILFAFILIRTIVCLCRRKLTRPCYVYGILLTAFFVSIVVFRNSRWWTVVLAVSFFLLYLTYGMWEHRKHFLTNVLWGILLHFLVSMGYCLLHRPYATYRFARYPFIFHTVTTTATYLTTVECAAMVLLLMKLYRTRKLRDVWKEWCLFGIVSSYMLFTSSRTGLLAVGITGLAAWLILVRGKGKERIKTLFLNLGWMVLALAVMFPVTFTLQRNVPGFVGAPRQFEIENYPEQVMRGHRLTSIHYMRIGRFVEVFADKVLGIPEGTFDFYGDGERYRRSHDEDGNEIADLVVSVGSVANQLKAMDQGNDMQDMQEEDYSNGRLDIFRSYLNQLNTTGHTDMGALLPDGEIAVHAHNIYLQVAYDHGIGVGVLFVIFGVASLVCAVFFYHRKKESSVYASLPMIVILSVAVAGMVEWIFHLSNPSGLVFMLVLAPLCYKESYESDK